MSMTSGIMWMGSIGGLEWRGRKMTPAEFFPILAEMGVETIDIFARSAEEWGVDVVKDALDSSGLRCACYYIACDLVPDDPEGRAAADEAFVRGIENAQALGAPICFTHGTQHGHAGEEAFNRYIERLGEKLKLFEGTGITLVIENAGTLLHKAED
ncbi:MAG: TIM barrel protein, partial [Armatimonadetes bacterium]|nr:TIM barrel protein [Armatimonadota bacterium]